MPGTASGNSSIAANRNRVAAKPMGSTSSSLTPMRISTTDVAQRKVTTMPMVTATLRLEAGQSSNRPGRSARCSVIVSYGSGRAEAREPRD
jgi:hypothetical protein